MQKSTSGDCAIPHDAETTREADDEFIADSRTSLAEAAATQDAARVDLSTPERGGDALLCRECGEDIDSHPHGDEYEGHCECDWYPSDVARALIAQAAGAPDTASIVRYRDAATGEYTTAQEAAERPETTIRETRKR